MMEAGPRIVLIHAVRVAIDPILDAFKSGWPQAQPTSLLDDGLAPDLDRLGTIEGELTRRIGGLADYGVAMGARGVLYTCSAFGAAIEKVQARLTIPVLKPNEAMLAEALKLGSRFAILATFKPTIASMESELRSEAGRAGRAVAIESIHVPQAQQLLSEGKAGEHDRLIARAAAAIKNVDAILLAQFSMARAWRAVAEVVGPTPVLTTPASAVSRLRSLVGEKVP